MPFVFILIGLVFLVTAVRGTQSAMFTLLKSEFVGTNSFVPWVSAILILGAVGYAKPIRPVADAMIGLVILAMVLANKGGFFTAFNQAIRNPVAPAVDTSSTASLGTPGTAVMPGTTSPAGVPAQGDGYLDNILTGLQGIQ